MSIEGRIAVDVNFTDSATVGGASSVKKIQLVDATQYSSGKVAIVTGTCGTAGVTFSPSNIFTNAAGESVVFSVIDRIAFCGSPNVRCYSGVVNIGYSEGRKACVTDNPLGQSLSTIGFVSASGTAAYTAVFYGS